MTNTGNQKFIGGYDNRFIVRYDRERISEKKAKLKWFLENYELCFGHLPNEQIPKAARILWGELAKRRAEMAQTTPRYAKRPEPASLPEPDKEIIMDTMKPVPPEVHGLIYQGVSAEDEGRKKYLSVRYKESPDDKFYQKECSNWEYGWGVEQVELHKLLRIPRVQVIKQSFYRRGGTERNPDHYKNAVNMESPMFFPTL